jgi:hypothetical protein
MPTDRKKAIDYDGLTKDFVTSFFPSFIQISNPALYAAVDWNVPPVFLEQELYNMMKGRYWMKGKKKLTDKLARLRLLNGNDHYVLVHVEFQHRPEDEFGKRMFTYFVLAFLKHDAQDFTAIAFFTGAAPEKSQLAYRLDVFGTKVNYQFISLVAVEQDEAKLIRSRNPVALGVLAVKYAYETEKMPEKRLFYKRKLFEIAASKGIKRPELVKLLIFVRDFVNLPPILENKFLTETLDPSTSKLEEMIISTGTKKMFEVWYERAHGFNPKKEIAKLKREREDAKKRESAAAKRESAAAKREAAAIREAAAAAAAIREAAAAAEREAAAAAEREATAIQEKENSIYVLHSNGVSIPLIATSMGVSEDFVAQVVSKKK